MKKLVDSKLQAFLLWCNGECLRVGEYRRESGNIGGKAETSSRKQKTSAGTVCGVVRH
ncbi:hypothetical protein ACW2QC_19735 [Virgibacillus sp. FSP13]